MAIQFRDYHSSQSGGYSGKIEWQICSVLPNTIQDVWVDPVATSKPKLHQRQKNFTEGLKGQHTLHMLGRTLIWLVCREPCTVEYYTYMYVPEVPESDSLVEVAADDCVAHSPSSYYVIAAGTSKQSPGTWNGNGKIKSSRPKQLRFA